jgi:hypothetical protein
MSDNNFKEICDVRTAIIESRLNSIDKNLEKLRELREVDSDVLVVQQQILKDHIKRTELLENIVLPLNKKMSIHDGIIKFIFKISAAIASMVGLTYMILQIINLWKK